MRSRRVNACRFATGFDDCRSVLADALGIGHPVLVYGQATDNPKSYALPLREQFDGFLDEHGAELAASLNDVSEEQARRHVVSSDTTLLGLVKHATFVEYVWFGEAISGRSRAELGIANGPAESFVLEENDTIESVLVAYAAACEQSRSAAAALSLDDLVTGNRRGPI